MGWEDVDPELLKMFRETSLDKAADRRKIREAFKDIQLGIDHILFNPKYTGIAMKESYDVNSRGVEIFSKSWIPENSPVKAIVCYCHGYGDTCTFYFEGVAKKLCSHGYAIFSMDYPGFGLSQGLHGYISNFNTLRDDAIEHFTKFKETPEYKDLPCFLLGESMGGAVALKIHLKQPDSWSGAILLAPMCKIADDVVPSWPVTQFLIGMSKLLPKRKLIPNKDIAELAFRDPKKKALVKFNVISYRGNPRLKTGVQMLKTTEEIGQHLENVSLPLLILHGKDDLVTDSSVSKALYEKASSTDKKIYLYDEGCHALLQGACDETVIKIFDDIISWLDDHSIKKSSESES